MVQQKAYLSKITQQLILRIARSMDFTSISTNVNNTYFHNNKYTITRGNP